MRLATLLCLAFGLCEAVSATAEVTDSQVNGFEVRQSVQIVAPAAKVWASLGQIGAWWNPQHSFSGDAHNLSLDLKAGGCLCEVLPGGGGVRHMTVIWVDPAKTIRMQGALGPLQWQGATGLMTWTLAEAGGKTTLSEIYDVGGYAKGGLDKWAVPVDGVLAEQLGRLKRFVETGTAK